jgi:hypothetical protein
MGSCQAGVEMEQQIPVQPSPQGGCLTAFIVTRTKFRNEMIKRDVARYNQQTKYSISILPLVHVSPRSFITNARRIYAGPAQRQQNGYNSEDLKTGRE